MVRSPVQIRPSAPSSKGSDLSRSCRQPGRDQLSAGGRSWWKDWVVLGRDDSDGSVRFARRMISAKGSLAAGTNFAKFVMASRLASSLRIHFISQSRSRWAVEKPAGDTRLEYSLCRVLLPGDLLDDPARQLAEPCFQHECGHIKVVLLLQTDRQRVLHGLHEG